jgi:hypothetical protein
MNAEPILVYIHIPKAGGTTLADWLYEQLRDPAEKGHDAEEDGWLSSGIFYYPSGYVRGPYTGDLERIRRVLPRPNLKAVFGHCQFGIHERLPRPASYITMLRHPVERIMSLYHFEKLVEARFGEHQGIKMPDGTTLESFVESPPFRDVDNGQTRRISGISPAVGNCTRAMVERAKENLRDHFAVVGITERFDETLVLLKRAFSWNRDVFYYPMNTNPGRGGIKHESQDTIDMILARNALDYELYQFATELMESAVSRYGSAFQDHLENFRAKKQGWYDAVTRTDDNRRMARARQRV